MKTTLSLISVLSLLFISCAKITDSVDIPLEQKTSTYIVSYNGNGSTGGTLPPQQTKTHDENMTIATNSGNLVKDSYTFAGWNTTSDGTGTDYAVGATYTANASITLYAKWTVLPTYTITYNNNGSTGGSAPSPQIKIHGVTLTLAGNSGSLVKSGYTFVGWNTMADGSGTDYAVGAGYTTDTAISLFAKWTNLPTYVVLYNGNGHTGGGTPLSQTKTQGVTLTLALNTGNLVKTGYSFAGWNTSFDGSGVNYASGATYSIDAAVTLYAKWEPLPTYMVDFNGNGNTGGSVPSTQIKIKGVTLILASNTGNLVKSGYTFGGWNTATNGGGTDYGVGSDYTLDFPITLYAKWTTLMTYSITYDGNGHTGGGVPSSQTKTQGVDLTLATNSGNLVKTGYVFAGWNTAKDGSGTSYVVGSSYKIDLIDTLYAKWAKIASNMKYLTGGTFLMGDNTYGWLSPAHQVTESGFWMDSTEVTQEDYFSVTGANPSFYTGNIRRPVDSVTWYDAVLYCNARSKRDGMDTVYGYTAILGTKYTGCSGLTGFVIDYTKHGYRLPTESEWEYACRGGTTTRWYWSDIWTQSEADQYCWNSVSAPLVSTQAVASKKKNGFNLYDMAGNVDEWCNDFYNTYSSGSQIDPTGPTSSDGGVFRIIRGGSFFNQNNDWYFSAQRSGYLLPNRSRTIGFRVVVQ